MRTGRLWIAGLVVLVLVAGGCTDDSESSEESAQATEQSSSEESETGAEADCPPGSEAAADHGTFDHDGVEREYELSVPGSYDATTAAPLLLNLHGLMSNGPEQDTLSNFPEAAGERGYIVVSPTGLPTMLPLGPDGLEATFWNITPVVDTSNLEDDSLEAADDLGFIEALLDDLETQLCIDADREYVSGMSNGAGMTTALICAYDDRFAAAAPVAGSNFVTACDATTQTPIVNFHGDADILAPYEGGGTLGFDLGLPTVEEQMGAFADLAGCELEPTLETLGDEGDVELRTWSGCADGIDVELYTVLEGGHTWPGVTTYLDAGFFEGGAEDGGSEGGGEVFGIPIADIAGRQTETIVATEVILDFFDAHSLPS